MKLFSFLLVVVLIFSLFSCGRHEKHTWDILTAVMSEAPDLPAGSIYTSQSEAGEKGYFPPSMKNSMYGEDSERVFALMEEFSVYTSSFTSPAEIAIFKCYSATDARSVEFMCRGRADILRTALKGTGFAELCDRIAVTRKGRYVIFIMAEESERLFKEAIRKSNT